MFIMKLTELCVSWYAPEIVILGVGVLLLLVETAEKIEEMKFKRVER